MKNALLSVSPLLAVSLATNAASLDSGRSTQRERRGPRKAAAAPRSSTTVLVPVNSQAVAPDGTTYLFTGTLTLTVTPPTTTTLALQSLTLSPSSVAQGGSVTGTVTLSRPASVDTTITLANSEHKLTLPASLIIKAGQSAGTFTVETAAAPNSTVWYTLTATLAGVTKTAALLVAARLVPGLTGLPGILDYQNADGTRATTLAYGQELLILGRGFGTARGTVYWQGGPVVVTSWTDTLIKVTLPTPPPPKTTQLSVHALEGAWYTLALPSDVPGERR